MMSDINLEAWQWPNRLIVTWSRSLWDSLRGVEDLQRAARCSSSIAAQFSDLTMVEMPIFMQVSNDEMQGDFLTPRGTAQFSDLPVTHGSSVTAQFKDMMMLDVWQSSAALRLAGPWGTLHHTSV